ncbi:MAG: FtsX-like permease family protein [Anaerohalosphaeraceae bacterium]
MLVWKLAVRYFRTRPSSWLAVAAVALCTFIVVVVLTVMNGLASDFKEKNHRAVGDCILTTDSLVGFPDDPNWLALLESQPFIEAVSPAVFGVGLITQAGADWNIAVQFLGIDPVRHSAATGFGRSLHYRKDQPHLAFVPSYAPNEPGCVVGIDLAGISRTSQGTYLHPLQPVPIRLILSSFPLTPRGAMARGGTDLVNSKTYYLADDSHTGIPQIDGSMIYLPLEEARLLTGMDSPFPRISSIHIRFKPSVGLQEGVEQVRRLWTEYLDSRRNHPYFNLLEAVRVQSWLENRRSRIAAVEKEQTMLILLFLMLGLITVFIVFVIFYMLVGHKSKDIGIFQSVGMSKVRIAQVFLNFAALIGLCGALLGAAGGCLFLVYINPIENWLFERFDFQLWDRTIYAIGQIPNQIQPEFLLTVGLAAVAACLAGALIPAFQAARKEPVEVLRVSQV